MWFTTECCVVCLLTLVAASVARGDATEKEKQKLQGVWEGTEMGQETRGTCTLTVDGDRIEFRGWNEQEWYKGTYELTVDTDPMQLRGTIDECPVPEMIGKESCAIYKTEDDVLTVAGRKPGEEEPPADFEADDQTRVFVLKRRG